MSLSLGFLFRRFFAASALVLLVIQMAGAAVIRDTEIEDGFLQIMRPMAADAGLDPNSLRLRIINDNQYNAFVTSDNTIYLNSGLVLKSQSILEIVGVLAHEIGHIASGHIIRRGEVADNSAILTALGTALAIGLSASGNNDAALGIANGFRDQSLRLYLSHSQQDEGVADEWVIRLMDGQSLSTLPLAEAMRRIGGERFLPESHQSDYYRTHPAAHDRSAIFQTHAASKDFGMPPAKLREIGERIAAKLDGWTSPPSLILLNDATAPFGDYKRAIALYRLSDLDAAANLMQKLLLAYPKDPYYHEFYGDILLSSGDADGAILAYQSALSLLGDGVNQGQIYFSLGKAFLARGDKAAIDAAIDALKTADAAEKDWAAVKHQLGISYGRRGLLADADLTLAEEALLRGDKALAKRLAQRAMGQPSATAIHKHLAADILAQMKP